MVNAELNEKVMRVLHSILLEKPEEPSGARRLLGELAVTTDRNLGFLPAEGDWLRDLLAAGKYDPPDACGLITWKPEAKRGPAIVLARRNEKDEIVKLEILRIAETGT